MQYDYAVTGLTCAHCADAVREEISEAEGVRGVTVDLVPGGTSTVTVASDQPLEDAKIGAALAEAGDYTLDQPGPGGRVR